jgi:hypothetical protein
MSEKPKRVARRIGADQRSARHQLPEVAPAHSRGERVARRISRRRVFEGEVVTVTVESQQDEFLYVKAPDGMKLEVPARDGVAAITVNQVGTWRYSWQADDALPKEIQVRPRAEDQPDDRKPSDVVVPLPSMTVARRPRY